MERRARITSGGASTAARGSTGNAGYNPCVPTHRFVFADVFTDTPLTGNQLAVFTDARGLSEEAMQALAREIGFSETVFVLPAEQGGTARIRIFNPAHEMPFAGHPVLGAAFVLGAPLQRGVVDLETGAGIVPVALERDASGAIVFGRMTQPVPRVEAVDAPERVLAALGLERATLPIELYDNGAVGSFRTGRASPRSRSRGSTWSRGRKKGGGAGCSGSTARTPRPARRPGRSRATSPATASSRGATRS